MNMRCILFSAVVAAGVAFGQKQIVNGSFETDIFAKKPGYRAKDAGISGWETTGAVGINPTADYNLSKPAFYDNGKIPDGKQVLFIQRQGEISQTVSGLKAGDTYQLTFYENARSKTPDAEQPAVTARVNGETVVSPHPVPAADAYKSYTIPFHFVQSAAFTVPPDGALQITIQSASKEGSVLLDEVRLKKISPESTP